MKIDGGLFEGTGKLGEIIVYRRMGQIIARTYNPFVKQPNTELQIKAQTRFGLCTSYCRENKGIYQLFWRERKEGQTYLNNAMSYLMRNATVEIDGKIVLDRSKVRHAQGDLWKGYNLKAELLKERKILFSWERYAGTDKLAQDDVFCFLYSINDVLAVKVCLTGVVRFVKSFVYKIPERLKGKEIAVYGFFKREETGQVSDDKFLGLFDV